MGGNLSHVSEAFAKITGFHKIKEELERHGPSTFMKIMELESEMRKISMDHLFAGIYFPIGLAIAFQFLFPCLPKKIISFVLGMAAICHLFRSYLVYDSLKKISESLALITAKGNLEDEEKGEGGDGKVTLRPLWMFGWSSYMVLGVTTVLGLICLFVLSCR